MYFKAKIDEFKYYFILVFSLLKYNFFFKNYKIVLITKNQDKKQTKLFSNRNLNNFHFLLIQTFELLI